MTIPENTGRLPAAPTFGKPSLMGSPRQTATVGDTTQPLRMLDALGDGEGDGKRAAPSRVRLWLLALSLTMLAVAAFSWWQQRDDAALARDSETVARPKVDTAMPPTSTANTLPPPSAAPGIEARPPVVANPPSSGPASIERSPETDPMLVLARPTTASRATPPSATTASDAVKRPKPAVPSASQTKVATAKERRRKSESARRANAVVTAKAAPSSRQAAPSATRDPDVTLLSAMLARLSSNNPNDAATIAQLVERCNAGRDRESTVAADCRRQVCVGHWGKTDACPMALVPKRN